MNVRRPARLVVGISTCPAYAQRRKAVRETWLPGCCMDRSVEARFFSGGDCSDSSAPGDTIALDCPDTYEALPLKTYRFLCWADEHYEFDYIFKCDDDTFVAVDRLAAYDTQDREYIGCRAGLGAMDRGYHISRSTEPYARRPYEGVHWGPWLSGGAGYFLSRRAVRIVIEEGPPDLHAEFYEDKMVGDRLRRRGILGYHDERLDSTPTGPGWVDGWVSMHPVGPELMPSLQELSRLEGPRRDHPI